MSQETTSQQQQMLRGTAWLTASNFISRLLGAIYIIPWYIWMGKHGAEANGLFTMGYNIYAWFLLISTAGVPVAVAKQVAKYTVSLSSESFSSLCCFWELSLLSSCTCCHRFLPVCQAVVQTWFLLCRVCLWLFWYSHRWASFEVFSKGLTISSLMPSVRLRSRSFGLSGCCWQPFSSWKSVLATM